MTLRLPDKWVWERRAGGGLGRSRRLDRVRAPGKGEVAHVLHRSESRW
jgi:hypothetical protein